MRKWIVEKDSIKNDELEKFKTLFKDTVLTKVINEYKDKIPDNLLFIDKPDTIFFKPVK